jgi:uncharacterized membrane protein (UPF0127 family)
MQREGGWRRGGSLVLAALLTLVLSGCVGSPGNTSGNGGTATQPGDATSSRASDAVREYPLDSLATTTVQIDEHAFRIWLAQDFDPDRPRVVQEGLMHVPTAEIEDDQGMLFVFYDERVRTFWMFNTIAPLDIAFARMDGTIVQTWEMPALTTHLFSSIEPAMFALEVKRGTFERLGIKAGDRIEIPATALDIP